jgi:hypothetical protein
MSTFPSIKEIIPPSCWRVYYREIRRRRKENNLLLKLTSTEPTPPKRAAIPKPTGQPGLPQQGQVEPIVR